MVYFILGILILLFYLFMTPKSIRWYLEQCHNGGLDRLHYRTDLSRHFSDIPITVLSFVGAFLALLATLLW